MLLGAASPSPNPFPFLVESSSQQQRWLPRPASCRRLRRSSMVQQQQQPSSVSAVRAVPIRGRRLPSTRPFVRRGRFPRPPARLPVPEPSSPGCRSSSAWLPSAWISTGAACRGFFRRRPLWLLARRCRSARPRPSTAAAARLRLAYECGPLTPPVAASTSVPPLQWPAPSARRQACCSLQPLVPTLVVRLFTPDARRSSSASRLHAHLSAALLLPGSLSVAVLQPIFSYTRGICLQFWTVYACCCYLSVCAAVLLCSALLIYELLCSATACCWLVLFPFLLVGLPLVAC